MSVSYISPAIYSQVLIDAPYHTMALVSGANATTCASGYKHVFENRES